MKSSAHVLILLLAHLTGAPAVAAWSWTPEAGRIAHYYISPYSQSESHPYLVLYLDQSFHSCGEGAAANIDSALVGNESFKIIVSSALAALAADKSVAFLMDGCDGARARVYGIKIAK